MSFFDDETRDMDKPDPRNKPKIGPGTYFGEQKKSTKESYAPFGSLSSKKNKMSAEKTIGPGQYSISK